ncbi:MAG: hypothetical protein H6862_04885 [Rhodospirillales bacterium]|nr:hypothetical protein [Rhodospirillales bacterium]
MSPSETLPRSVFLDVSLWGVIFGNLFSIGMAVFQRWDLAEIMWIFWAQSVGIGLMNFVRILSLKEFSTEGFKINDHPVEPTTETKIQTAFFFLVHYGLFHAVYAVFLWEKMDLSMMGGQDILLLALCALGFLGVHGFSLAHNFSRDFRQKRPNIGTLMFYPYLRILPMHLTIVFGGVFVSGEDSGAAQFSLILFMSLKTLADAGMHMVEHHIFRKI